jgi:hypothetical protein
MKLIKYCNSKFHPRNCKTIQVGTLDYYRNHENNFISDPSEAILENIKFKNTSNQEIKFTADEFNWLFKGHAQTIAGMSISPGSVFTIYDKIKVPNSYIFSCSQVEEPCEKQMKELGYDSWYEIKYPKVFFGLLTQEILKNIKINKRNDIQINYKTMSGLINYGQMNNIEFNSEIDLINFLLYRKNEVSQLNKDVKYWKNTEFRYSILLNYINSILPVAVESEPLIIQNRMLLPYIDY